MDCTSGVSLNILLENLPSFPKNTILILWIKTQRDTKMFFSMFFFHFLIMTFIIFHFFHYPTGIILWGNFVGVFCCCCCCFCFSFVVFVVCLFVFGCFILFRFCVIVCLFVCFIHFMWLYRNSLQVSTYTILVNSAPTPSLRYSRICIASNSWNSLKNKY